MLALEMASPGNQHCANCIDTLSFHISRSFCLLFFSIFSAANRSTRYAESRHFTTVERLVKFHFASLHINEVARRTGVVVLARFRLPVWGHSDVFAATAETMQSLSVQFICTIESSAGYLATFISLLGFDCHS